MSLVKHDYRILTQILVNQSLSQKHTVSHVFYESFAWSVIFKTNWITDLVSQFHIHLLTHSFCNTHSSYSSGLSAAYFTSFCKSSFIKILSNLCGLSWTCLSDNNQHIVVHAGLNKLFSVSKNRQVFFLLDDGHVVGSEIFFWLIFSGNSLIEKFVQISNLVFVLLLSNLSSLFCVLNRVHCWTIECSFRIFNYSNRR